MRIQCVVFDFDGVLVDSNEIKRDAYFELFGHVAGSRALIEAVLHEEIDGDRHDIIRSILRQMTATGLISHAETDDAVVAIYAGQYNGICEQAVAMAPETAGCSDALQLLADRYPLYINSATPEEPLRRIVERRRWKQLFKDVLGRPRTKTQNLQRILAREGIPPQALAFVGDSPHDRAAADVCGCLFIAFLNGFHRVDHPGSAAIMNLSDLSEAVGKNRDHVRRP